MDTEFWKNKKVLITGHTGFKGSWLSLWLDHLGAHPIGYALVPPTEPSLFEAARIDSYMNSYTEDIRNLDMLKKVVSDHRPEIVIHMAAQSLVRRSYQHPIETYTTNVIGTANTLEAVRQNDGIRVVLVITSDKCYSDQEWVWGYRESDPIGGFDPYSSSKGCAELVTDAYRNSFFPQQSYPNHGVAIASARSGNVIGGGDWSEDRIVPDIMRAIQANRPIWIRNPNAIRPWQHVLEPLHGYLCLIENLWHKGLQFGGAWNFGPSAADTQSVSWLVEKLRQLMKVSFEVKIDNAEHPHEANYLKLDSSKARGHIGWAPVLDIDTTLEWVAEWYESFLMDKDVHKATLDQIARYESLAA